MYNLDGKKRSEARIPFCPETGQGVDGSKGGATNLKVGGGKNALSKD